MSSFKTMSVAEAWGLLLTLPLTHYHLQNKLYFSSVSICSRLGTMFSHGINYQKDLSRCEIPGSSFSASVD